MTKTLFTFFLFATGCFSQTGLKFPGQVSVTPTSTPSTMFYIPTVGLIQVSLDPASLTIDRTNPAVPMLKATVAAGPPGPTGATGPMGPAGPQGQPGTGITIVFVDQETPSGTIDGTNTTFTLAALPNPASSLHVYRNGLRQKSGMDYNFSGGPSFQFVAVATPQPGDTIIVEYRH